MKKKQSLDWVLLISVLVLMGLGVVLVYSSSSHMAMVQNLPTSYFVKQHIIRLLIGGLLMWIGSTVPAHYWKFLARPLFLLSILFLLLLFTPLGISLNGARRWLRLGISFQPAEFAKIAFVFFLAFKLNQNEDRLKNFAEGMLPQLVVTSLLFVLLMLQPNFSMALAVVAIALSMVFVAGVKMRHLGAVGIAALPLFALLAYFKPYRLKRIVSFLNPAESGGADYQQTQALLSLGNGGFWGTGLGASTQKLGYLPMASTDAIYAVLGEELGFVGSAIVLALFGVLIYRGLRIARWQQEGFASLIAVGLVASIAINVFVHVGVCTRLGPPTGQPLPFVSYGGTNLLTTMFACGVLLKLSRTSGVQGGVG